MNGCRRHCIAGIQNQVEHNLLQLHSVSHHARKRSRHLRIDRDSALNQIAMDQSQNFDDDVSEPERPRLDIGLLEERPQARDDFSGATVVVRDVFQYLLQVRAAGIVPLNHSLRRARIGEDRGERLIELVRQGAGQLTERGNAAQVRQLALLLMEHVLAALSLGYIANDDDIAGLAPHLRSVGRQRRSQGLA